MSNILTSIKGMAISSIRAFLYVVELLIMFQIFKISYIRAGADCLNEREFYVLFPVLLILSALYGISLNTTTNIRQVGVLSPNVFWILLCLFLGMRYDIPHLTGAVSAWMIEQAVFIFTDADCYEYAFFKPISSASFPIRNYRTIYSEGYIKARKRNIIYFLLGNAVIHLLFVSGIIPLLVDIFY